MLRFDLTELLRTPGMRQVFDLHEPPFTDEDVEYVAPITGRITVTNTGTMVLVRGPIETVIGLECSRCLEPVRAPIHTDLEEEFDLQVVEDAAHHVRDVHVVEEEIGRVFEGKILHLDVLIRQAALLNAPLQPLVPGKLPRHSNPRNRRPGCGSDEKLAVPRPGQIVTRMNF